MLSRSSYDADRLSLGSPPKRLSYTWKSVSLYFCNAAQIALAPCCEVWMLKRRRRVRRLQRSVSYASPSIYGLASSDLKAP
ncbi:hypothetical protein Y1Q_0018784 [Alligator mississippiensis]|uniref:Uncharacterized protein n=1 Tax=Alligator mississippiensis TaxID=8496 RepID=A0A151NTI1_ALLMI|nr:hypothetical protein Y1Q_0018784 [Alligator mississippiensis]